MMTDSATRIADEVIHDLAAGQHGLVTRVQLLRSGVPPRTVDRKEKGKRLRPVHRGVYQVGPVVPPRAREMAAVLACGDRAVTSHLSGAAIWEFALADTKPTVDVTVEGRDCGRRPGIAIHRVAKLAPSEVTTVDGVPITSATRTIFDLASVLHGRELERVVARAEDLRLTTRSELQSLLPRHSRRRGVRALLPIIEGDPALTRSEAEERFLALIQKTPLPAPEVNVKVGKYKVDFLWRRERVVVEVDGFAFHSSWRMFESDRKRDKNLSAMGFQVVRVTWSELTRQQEAVLVQVAQTLALARSRRA